MAKRQIHSNFTSDNLTYLRIIPRAAPGTYPRKDWVRDESCKGHLDYRGLSRKRLSVFEQRFEVYRWKCIIHPEHMLPEFPRQNSQETDWQRTKMAEVRLRAAGKFVPPRIGDKRAPYGYFAGRPIIGSGMGSINGGVYLGAHAREAVVVDDNLEKPGGEKLQALYSEMVLPKIERAAKKYGRNPKDVAIAVIFNVVSEVLPYDKEKSEALIQQLTKGIGDSKVHLASFLNFGAGVCRHQALLVAYLIEKLMQEDNPAYRLNGQLSIERNKVALTNENLAGAHAWVRYTSTSGEIRIIDVAQKRCGRLEKLIHEPGAWEYARPEDLERFKA